MSRRDSKRRPQHPKGQHGGKGPRKRPRAWHRGQKEALRWLRAVKIFQEREEEQDA